MALNSRKFPSILELCTVQYRSGQFSESLGLIDEALKLHPDDFALRHLAALCALRLGDSASAEHHITKAIALKEDDAASWNVLGEAKRQRGLFNDALECYKKALDHDNNSPDVWCNLGNAYDELARDQEAEDAYLRAIKKDPLHSNTHYNLGNFYLKTRRYAQAEQCYRLVLERQPKHLDCLNNYGALLSKLSRHQEALGIFERLATLAPQSGHFISSYAGALSDAGQWELAREKFKRSLELLPREQSDRVLVSMGNIEKSKNNKKEAAALYRQALALQPLNYDAQKGLLNIHVENNDIIVAKKMIDEFYEKFPQSLALLYSKVMLELFVSYETEEQIHESRRRYEEGLRYLDSRLRAVSGRVILEFEELIGTHQPFYLPYQGLSVVALQKLYAEMIASAMQRLVPLPPPQPRSIEGRKIRVGIVSGFFRNHSNYKIPIRGWIKTLSKDTFELFGYHIQDRVDEYTREASTIFDHFHQGPKGLHAWINTIRDDQLDILLYPEIGMDPMCCKLACLRLAPVQVNSWGHPVTSGLPTIDYYLSSELMEPPDAEKEYTEKLIRLPHLSINYDPPKRTILPEITRETISARKDAVLFWCCQVIYKYLPQYDWVYAEIASRVPHAQFVFITIQTESEATQIFKKRMKKAFEAKGLDPDLKLVFLAGLNADQFSTTASLCDVGLDSIGWSGCNSTLETLAQGVPVITRPGKSMREKHSEAILKMIDVPELITTDIESYIERAVLLGCDKEKRRQLSERILKNINKAYHDTECVKALERHFVDWVAR